MQRIKYPRTYHLPYSLSKTDDDKTLKDDSQFNGMEVVVTIKMDGENTTIYPDGYIHARSMDGNSYEWQNWLKSKVWDFCYQLPEGSRIMGENLYAKHSIGYKFNDISETFQVFGVGYTEEDEDSIYHVFGSWDEVENICEAFGLKHVPVIYRGKYNKEKIMEAFQKYCDEQKEKGQEVEGFVVRNVKAFYYGQFDKNVAKFVRANHVQTDKHWRETWVKNEF